MKRSVESPDDQDVRADWLRSRRRLWRRRATFAAMCLLGGAVFSILNAWACAIWCTPKPYLQPISFQDSQAIFSRQFGQGRFFDRAVLRFGTQSDLLLMTPVPGPEETLDEREPYWITGSELSWFGYDIIGVVDWLRGPMPQVTEFSAGWPIRCLRGHEAIFPARAISTRSGVFVVKNPQFPWPVQGERRVPYLPIWSGLLASSVLYGSILWLLLCGPFELRRLRRRWRGLCLQCAYDLRGAEHSRCPECGAAVH